MGESQAKVVTRRGNADAINGNGLLLFDDNGFTADGSFDAISALFFASLQATPPTFACARTSHNAPF
jgi:hypothetical protein